MTSPEPPHPQQDASSELTESLAETASSLFSAGGLELTLQRIVALAVETIAGCDFAGIFVLDGDTIRTSVHTDPIVIEIDSLQREVGEGPCLDAIADGGTIYADDLADDARWPEFGPQADAGGIRSALALRLEANGTRGALNLYARYPRAFGVVDRANGVILAVLSSHALSAAESHDEQERRADALQAGLISREVIGQAEGILMERERITSDQAFDILRRASQHLNIKLRDVAQRVVDTGEKPDAGSTT